MKRAMNKFELVTVLINILNQFLQPCYGIFIIIILECSLSSVILHYGYSSNNMCTLKISVVNLKLTEHLIVQRN